MSKSVEFNVAVVQVGLDKNKIEKHYAKNVTRLIQKFPKNIKRKWQFITWENDGVEKKLTRQEYEVGNKLD